jgi:serine/threonine-protein kinase HipA
LEMNRSGLVTWIPEAAWEARGQHPRLGVAFLRVPGPRSAGTGLPPWFENLLPEEGSALRQRLCSAHGLRETNRFQLMGAIGVDLSGAVEVHARDSDEEQLTPTPMNMGTTESREDELFRFALAGMQPKLSMSMANDRLVLRAQGPQGLWIVKLPSRSYPELPDIERATMTWAKLAGFDVPTHSTVSTESLEGVPAAWCQDLPKAFAIRRFDRREDGSKVHQEDFCQGLELLPVHKHGETGISLDGALRFVADVGGEGCAREMSRRIGFVIASGNDDAHLKNWSFLWGNADRPTLTPCYDFVTTISWRDRFGWGVRGGPTISLGLGKEKRFALLDNDTLLRHAARSGFLWAVEETMQGIERARNAWSTIEAEMPIMMRDALVEHWNNVPLLRALELPRAT